MAAKLVTSIVSPYVFIDVGMGLVIVLFEITLANKKEKKEKKNDVIKLKYIPISRICVPST